MIICDKCGGKYAFSVQIQYRAVKYSVMVETGEKPTTKEVDLCDFCCKEYDIMISNFMKFKQRV